MSNRKITGLQRFQERCTFALYVHNIAPSGMQSAPDTYHVLRIAHYARLLTLSELRGR